MKATEFVGPRVCGSSSKGSAGRSLAMKAGPDLVLWRCISPSLDTPAAHRVLHRFEKRQANNERAINHHRRSFLSQGVTSRRRGRGPLRPPCSPPRAPSSVASASTQPPSDAVFRRPARTCRSHSCGSGGARLVGVPQVGVRVALHVAVTVPVVACGRWHSSASLRWHSQQRTNLLKLLGRHARRP